MDLQEKIAEEQARVRELEDENQRMRDDLAHATRFQIRDVEVYESISGWVLVNGNADLSKAQMERRGTRDAALSRAREIAEEEA